MEERVSLTELARVVTKQRKLIVLATLGTFVVSAAVSLLLPQWYRARATILPPESSMAQSMDVGVMMRLAGYKPANIPTLVSQSDIYASILQSSTVKDAVIDSLDLIRAFKAKNMKGARDRVDDRLDISVTPDALVEVKYEDRDRARAAQVTNAFVRELDRFNTESRVTTAKKVRQFVEHRIEETRKELDAAETELKQFKESTGAILISEQAKASIGTAAEIYGKMAALEVDLERLRQYATDKSPEVVDIRSQIRAMERKLGEMGYMTSDNGEPQVSRLFPRFNAAPELEQRLGELLREVEVKRSVYAVLSEQYEEARIQEMKDTPTIQVLDWAQPPMVRAHPKRKVIVSVSTACALLVSAFLAVRRERLYQKSPGAVTPI